MTKFFLIPVALLTFLFSSFSYAAKEGVLECPLVPVLAESFLKTHVEIKSPSEEVYQRTVDQMIKRLDGSKMLLLESDVASLKPKLMQFLKTMRTNPDCKNINGIKDVLVQRTKDQLAYAKKMLGPKYKLDESVELQLDPDKRSYAKDIDESHERETVQIHFQISNYLMTDMKLAKAKKQLVHRYELSLKRMKELKNADLYDYLVNAFASALDPHSSYLSPEATEDFRINMRLSLEGIGASLSNEDGYTVIQELIPGGAAAKSNQLQAKDKIIAVSDGKGTMVNVIDMDLKDVVRMIRGHAGTPVKLTVLREKPEIQRINLTLVRSKVQLEDDAAKVEFYDRKVDGKKYKLARIELPGFYGGPRRADRSSYKDVAEAVAKAVKGGAQGIVFDLSSNSGGLLDEAVRIAGLFIEKGNVVATKDSDGEVQMLDDIDSRVQFKGPMVVLTSRLSASASEIVSGALQDYKRAVIVGGDHTYGKGTVQAVLPLQGDYGIVKVTTGIFYIPGGNSTQHRGVTSDISFPSPFSTSDIGEKYLDYSLKPDSIKPFLSTEADEHNTWVPVSKAEIEKLRMLSNARVSKSKEFADIAKDLKEMEKKKGVIRLSDMRTKEAEQKKKDKNKSPKAIAKERNKPQINEALNILADFVRMREAGSANLIGGQANRAKAKN